MFGDDKEYWRGQAIQQNLDMGKERAQHQKAFNEAVTALAEATIRANHAESQRDAAEKERDQAQLNADIKECENAALAAQNEAVKTAYTGEMTWDDLNQLVHTTSHENNNTLAKIAQHAFFIRASELGLSSEQYTPRLKQVTHNLDSPRNTQRWLDRIRVFDEIQNLKSQKDMHMARIQKRREEFNNLTATEITLHLKREPSPPEFPRVRKTGKLIRTVYVVESSLKENSEHKRKIDADRRAQELYDELVKSHERDVAAIRVHNNSVEENAWAQNPRFSELRQEITQYESEVNTILEYLSNKEAEYQRLQSRMQTHEENNEETPAK